MTTTETSHEVEGKEPSDGRRRWVAFGALILAVFMDMLDGNVVSVAIPSIQRTLQASYTDVQWMTAGYVLAFAVVLVTGGRLGDIYGRKRVFQIGLAGFALASLLCGLAVDPAMLIGSRVAQGLMAGLMVPQVLSILHVTFVGAERAKAFAILGIVGGLAATVAPLIGGVVVQLDLFGLSWRPVFLMNVVIAGAALIVGGRHITDSTADRRPRLDLVGMLLSAAVLLLVLVPLTLGHDLGWPAWCTVSVIAAALLAVVFVAHQRRVRRSGSTPLLALELFSARSYVAGNLLNLAVYTFIGMFFLAWYLFMQIGLGWGPLHAGLTALAFCIGAFITSALSVTVLIQKFGRAVLQVGAVVIAAGIGLFLWVLQAQGSDIGTWGMVLPLLLVGLGFGLVAPPIAVFALVDVPQDDAGSASGVINTTQQLGFAVGIALVSLTFLAPLGAGTADVAERLAPGVGTELVAVGLPDARAEAFVASVRACAADRAAEPTTTCGADAELDALPQTADVLSRFRTDLHEQTFVGAFQWALVAALVLSAVVLVLTFVLPRRLAAEQAAVPTTS